MTAYHAKITGDETNGYQLTLGITSFNRAIAMVENATGGDLRVGLAGLESDGTTQKTVEIKDTAPDGPNTLLALDDDVRSVRVSVGSGVRFGVGGGITGGTVVGTPFAVNQTYRQCTVADDQGRLGAESGLSYLYLSVDYEVDITNSTEYSIDIFNSDDLSTRLARISKDESASIGNLSGVAALTISSADPSSPSDLGLTLYDTTGSSTTVTGSTESDAQPNVITPPDSGRGTVTVYNQQTTVGMEIRWPQQSPPTSIDPCTDPDAPPSGSLETDDANTLGVPWYIQWWDTDDPDPKIIVKRLSTSNGRGNRG